MYKKGIYEITQNKLIAKNIYEMVLAGDTQWITAPGQFVNVQLDGFFLRRPLAVCDWEAGQLTLVYEVVGKGTKAMAAMAAGEKLDLLTGLGNGYDLERIQGRTAVVAGGAGVPPMYALAKALKAQGKDVFAVLGFRGEEDVFYKEKFEALGVPAFVTTEDGSVGTKGYVTAVLENEEYAYYCTCGPEPMMAAVHRMGGPGQLSFDSRMGCGFGACMGCSCQTIAGTKRICVEGPVMDASEVTL